MTAYSTVALALQKLDHASALKFVELVLVRWPFFMTMGRKALGNLERIERWSGRGPVDRGEFLERTMRLYTRFTLCLMGHPGEWEYAREKVDLPLLADIDRLRAEGKGVILAVFNHGMIGHGLWALLSRREVLIPVLSPRTYRHLPPPIPDMFVPVGESARRCFDHVRAGGLAALFSDVNFLSHRMKTEFCGAPAPFGYAAARLAKSTGATVLPVFAVERGDRCVFEADPPIRPDGLSVREMTRAQAAALERRVAEDPAQWLVYEDFWDTRRMDFVARLARRLAPWS